MRRIAIIGAGFTGAVIARELADAGCQVDVFETRDHIAGNCYTEVDKTTGITVSRYGAHIFHTGNNRVWEYIQRFGHFVPYAHHVKAIAKGCVYSLPINLHTINQFFGTNFTPEEARRYVDYLGDKSIIEPKNFEEQALRFLGVDLYETFFKGYTLKQWGRDPKEIPASVLKRLPIRFNYDDRYFDHPYQALPLFGYTQVVYEMLDHPRIAVQLGVRADRTLAERYDHTFYSGPLDAWFNHSLGRLSYRTLDFVTEIQAGDAQGCPVMNYCDQGTPFTRRIEYKHFDSSNKYDMTVVHTEYSREASPCDEPYYPVRAASDKVLMAEYEKLVAAESDVTFAGRLSTYRYIDVDQAILEALIAADKFLGRVL